ncbi:VWA domain-containing protein [Rhodococcus fascians]|nr:VWA domain-containing protein [Rhodococcus fascians]MBY3826384.1 VWA domain-containing protein [Rhodococcus fascians]MBY3836846.1 VWA domain-containing protein [Rhodococcus fascians]MBY3865687.1 VWA domain-containing protein [Rhodococcus fascians]MBY3885528.1 VWA domain-containing protein [Rhodococcus fascians]
MRRSRYGRYHEGPDPLAPPVDLREALDAIGEDVLEGASPRRALQEMLRRGTKNMRGLDDLAAQAAKRRRDLLKQNNLDGTLQEVRELLDKAVLEERKALARALDDDARFQEMQIGDLSPSTAQAVQELSDYDWRSSEGRENYEKIKDLLGREMLDQRFAGMKQALEGATEQDRQAISAMLKDLNELLDAHNKGENTDEQFDEFMNKHGQHFPENPKNVDELLDSLAERAAAAQRLRNSLTPEQRAELDALAQQAFGDSNLLDQLDQLDQNLQQARPGEDWDGSQNFRGENGMGLGDGTGALQDIADLENLGNQLSQQYNGAALDDIDADALLKQLGPEAAADARMLSELEKALQQQGFMDKGADGQWRLSPKAMRQLGQSALKDVAGKLSRRGGERDTRKAGAMGEPTGASRTWEFGDTEPWDVTRTVNNAVFRTAAQGSGFPVQLQVTDVEISETETRTQAAVALLVDTSFSMVMDGRWVPMKRTALALNHLVSTRFRGDDLQLIGFGRHAQTLTASELAGLDGAYDQGTNLHHALMLAVRHLRRHPNAQPVVLIVTDGEPTAHLEPDGHAYFDYPPSSKTLGLTVRELDTVAKLGAQVTIFRLGDDPGLARVVDKMAERVGGRVIAPDLDGLGAAVVSDYLKRRRS